MKKFIILFCFSISLVLGFSVSVLALDGNDSFQTAYSATVGINAIGTITAGDIDYYKYEIIPTNQGVFNGYPAFNIYSNSSADLIGSVYSERKVLWWTYYDFVQTDDNSGAGTNFRIELETNKTFYYVKVSERDVTYTKYTTLYFKENLDVTTSTYGGIWASDAVSRVNPPNVSIFHYVDSITYYTPEQTAMFYAFLDENFRYQVIDALISGGEGAVMALISYYLFPEVTLPSALTIGFVAAIIGYFITPETANITRAQIYDMCGGYDVIVNGMNLTYFTKGLKVTENITYSIYPTLEVRSYIYEPFVGNTLIGYPRERGTFQTP
ncbi:MAG: hypothetical protein KKE16_01105 [Firmicutes bacterium]|nr:hypothetical protein [Bacillota bacterium]